MIAHSPQVERSRQGCVVGRGTVLQCLDEEQPNETVGLHRAGQTCHEDDMKLARSGRVLLAKGDKVRRSMAGLVNRGKSGWAWA